MNIPTAAIDPQSYPDLSLPSSLRIAFIHPDLGLGGAERLIVDAAVALQKRGHEVTVFTSYHEPGKEGRSFDETRDGTLQVHVLGNWLFPRSVLGRFTIVCAMLRQLHLVASFLLACLLHHLSSLPLLSLFVLPLETAFASSHDWSPRRQIEPFDVIVVDQLSTAVPLLRWFGQNRVVFYCHFPDLLLSPSASSRNLPTLPRDPRAGTPFSFAGEIRKTYRAPIDAVEMATTGEADKILVNSEFTASVFERTFAQLRRRPRVVYPAVNLDKAASRDGRRREGQVARARSDQPMLLSINRFEGKKDLALALEAFAQVRSSAAHPSLRLVLAGGYDPRLADNVRTLSQLQQLAGRLGLSSHAYAAGGALPDRAPDVVFLLNISAAQKALLLDSRRSGAVALLYTPMYEHFGIVPLEGMAAGLPGVATQTGGPTETVVDRGLDDDETTGLLRPRDAAAWADAVSSLLALDDARRAQVGAAGQRRVRTYFSTERLGADFELACVDAAKIGMPIPHEVGFKKMLAFFGIGSVCLAAAVVAFVVGRL
ncbi:glycosyltransferase family 4 protein [Rhodotorula graminis WP1]|uniref:Alpha-1,3/1,6-mannosyltransferase ALG2 n=1 Tax=Rhodotorula graminis (strain WP1) TaxID=578459 RepID=A0A194S5B6_RHOGW|nr:glycosyltransferase family 4 protein [Rhodotorula graminis WP1]KPV75705.1 glycosyltransferase family 4 protein [Rhodotorula graminis WP1]